MRYDDKETKRKLFRSHQEIVQAKEVNMDLMTKVFKEAPVLGVKGLAVKQEGKLLFKIFWDEDKARNVYSVSKSITSLAMGFAVEEGLVHLDERLEDIFETSYQGVTVRELLTMQLGNRGSHMMVDQRATYSDDMDWLHAALNLPQEDEAGQAFVYSNHGPYLAGVIIQERAHQDLVAYLQTRLFSPLGIKMPRWERDNQGRVFGASGLELTLDDQLAIGECLRLGGQDIIPRTWIEEATKEQVKLEDRGPHQLGYGYLFWRGMHNSFRADGKDGQFIIILPEKHAVVSVLSDSSEPDKILELIHGPLYEAL